jgi:uncharacterized HAD superfamily protein
MPQTAGSHHNDESNFGKFLLKEYDNIAAAHFNTVDTIATFFKHYLLIVSLPLPLFAVVFMLANNGAMSGVPALMKLAVAGMASVIALVGLCVMGYIVNLRFDAILYARTVNGIRGYFSHRSGLQVEDERHFRVLPRSIHIPSYFELRYFLFVVLTFALLDCAYMLAGCLWYADPVHHGWSGCLWVVLVVFVFGILHVCLYLYLACHRETGYLPSDIRPRIIGVDIDGVLNLQRRHFCNALQRICNKSVAPEDIVSIPVHKCAPLNVTKEEEHEVFNDPHYWKTMPPMDDAADVIRCLRNAFGYRIHIFTHRPWPDPTSFSPTKSKSLSDAWLDVDPDWQEPPIAIRKLTEEWLESCGIKHNELIVEHENTCETDSEILRLNRFAQARLTPLPIFIEDDLSKARKLANTCEIVFLINQPYNQAEDDAIPFNIVRVNGWKEIHRYFCEFL